MPPEPNLHRNNAAEWMMVVAVFGVQALACFFRAALAALRGSLKAVLRTATGN